MFTRSPILSSILFGSLVLAGGTMLQAGTVQGYVKGPDGKPISGADVHVARSNTQTPLQKARTDNTGQYIFKGLSEAFSYRLTAWVNKVPTTIENVKTREEGPMRVDFDIKSGPAKAAKKVKHWVWFPAQTGSNLGGRWVEVDENGRTATGAQPVETVSGKALEHAYRRQGGY